MRLEPRVVTLAAVVAALCLLGPGVAFAQPSPSDRELARGLMDEGDRKRAAADLKGALKAYSAADGIMNVPTTTIEVARTQIALGQLIEARETLARLLRTPPKANEPSPFAAARKTAETLSADVVAKIPTLAVTTNADRSQPVEIRIDSEVLPPGTHAPRNVNPGSHAVVVHVGSAEHKQDVMVLERENKVVTVDVKDPGGDAPMKTAPPPPTTATPEKKSPAPKLLMFGGFGLAAVGIGVGAVTGIMSINKTNALKPTCPNNACPVGSQADVDSANTLGNISTVAFVVGGVGAAAGVVGLVLSGTSSKEPRVRAVLGPSYAGVAGAF